VSTTAAAAALRTRELSEAGDFSSTEVAFFTGGGDEVVWCTCS
jgi:hypothetical protein